MTEKNYQFYLSTEVCGCTSTETATVSAIMGVKTSNSEWDALSSTDKDSALERYLKEFKEGFDCGYYQN